MTLIEDIVKDIKSVPLLSKSAGELIALVSKENYTLQEIKSVIEKDSILTVKLLKIVNSAAYSLLSEVTSIERAIPYLGDKLILSIALENSASAVLNSKLDGYFANEGAMWSHNLKTAIGAKELTKYTKARVDSGLAYTAGLVHDIGKSIMSIYLNSNSDLVAENFFESEKSSYLEIEREILGIDHCQSGYMMSKHWNLPKVLSEIILHHHNPSKCPDEFKPLCYAVHLADYISMLSGTGTGIDSLYYQPDPNFQDFINIEEKQIEAVVDVVESEFAKIQSSIST